MTRADEPAPACRNCGAAAPLRYCPDCGQATALHPPSVPAFLHEFLGHYVAFEGPLWRTMGALLLRPGRLTADYFAGRRARYIPPLRLYLTFSLILFAVSGWSGGLKIGNEAFEFKLPSELTAEQANAKLIIGPRTPVSPTGMPAIDGRIARVEAMTPAQRSDRLRAGMREYFPYVLIVLVPVFALLLKLAYWNRERLYGEHLVVAFHAQTVVLIFALISAIPIGDWFGSLIGLLLGVQGFIALRRVYGGRRWTTLVREALLFGSYGAVVIMALVATVTLALAL